MKTQMGWAAAAARDGRIVATSLSRTRAAAVSDLGVAVDFARPDDLLRQLAGDLEEYFAGESVDFGRYEVDISGRPPFLRRALRAARRIPRGQVRSYAWLAAAAGNPRAARAAGQAMARNPAPIIIPCHRVIASDGSLGGFGGGLEMKRRLLALEGALLEAVGVRRPRQTRPTQTHCALGAAVPRGGRRRSHSAEPTPP
jgi:methylated-DNA-[protein]-cysteine S-methyltransferase